VLARSPLPPSADEDAPPEPVAARSPWKLPLIAAAVTLVLVAGGLVLFFSLLSDRGATDRDGERKHPSIAEAIATSRKHLSEGRFHEAAELLQDARARGERHPDLGQLHRQATLLAGLLHMSLEEIIEKGQAQRAGQTKEWEAQLKTYLGRSVFFDDIVQRDPDGTCRLLNYELTVAEEKGILKLDLDLLRQLPELRQPRRLIFGARLANVTHGAGKTWVIEFERDSGVLLTDEGAASILFLGPIDDALRDVLSEQARWVRP
jgi:hypothetical protein